MSWTDERVEMLQQMWSEGQSAAQIAKTLGGVTRNAVIGKVHRLGLSNRAPTAAQRAADAEPEGAAVPGGEAAAVKPQTAAPEAAPNAAPKPAPEPAPVAETVAETVAEPDEVAAETVAEIAPVAPRPAQRDPLRREPAPMTEERLEVLANLAEIEKTARRVTLMDLTERVCKWPIGDPTDPAFRFCGLPAQQGKPYCEAHVAVAFQPMSSRRDRDRQRIRN